MPERFIDSAALITAQLLGLNRLRLSSRPKNMGLSMMSLLKTRG
jgi:hypothetical protein